VADVELFGGIGRAVIDNRLLAAVGAGCAVAKLFAAVVVGEPVEESVGPCAEVDEAGAGDCDVEAFAKCGG